MTPEDAEAKPFTLPELPVSVSVGTLRADRVQLGPQVLGEAATLRVESSLELAEGAAEAALDITRIGRDDKITLDAAFSNESRELRLDLDFDEAAGGLVSGLLRMPGRPALRLQVAGDAPLSEFEAQVALSSDGAQRLGGARWRSRRERVRTARASRPRSRAICARSSRPTCTPSSANRPRCA